MGYHTLTWLLWLSAAAYLGLINAQPLQSVLLILATGMVFTVASRRNTPGQSLGMRQAEGWSTFLRFGLWVWGIAAVFNLLFAHAGNRVLFTLPQNWPLIGGKITLEALLYGLANGASLFAILLIFASFNLVVDSHRLLRWLPPGLFQAGLVVSIALSFVPQMMASLKDIREAQLVRGFKFRGLRDLIPLFIPLVTTALERSLTLAESMEARGFGGVYQEREPARRGRTRSAWLGAMTIVGLATILMGLLLRASNFHPGWLSTMALGMGGLVLIGALYLQGQRLSRTHYRREAWSRQDLWIALASAASMLITASTQALNSAAFSYYPYPPLSMWPTFSPIIGLAILLLAAPALLPPSAMHAQVAPHPQPGPADQGRGDR